jgi:hypothetical protein
MPTKAEYLVLLPIFGVQKIGKQRFEGRRPSRRARHMPIVSKEKNQYKYNEIGKILPNFLISDL